MELLDRFAPLMSQALHFAGCPQGMALPLADIHTALCALADAERSTSCQDGAEMSDDPRRHEYLSQSRFAVYAWVDETLLNAARPDATAWMGMSLQSRYFETSTAGREVFVKFGELLDVVVKQPEDTTLSSLLATPGIAGGDAGLTDEAQEGMKLATDMEKAATQPLDYADRELLRVYAECLLYGFCGRFFPYPDVLRRLRAASRTLLRATAAASRDRSEPARPVSLLHWLEPVLYVAVPLFATLAFALYCADILANLPLTAFKL